MYHPTQVQPERPQYGRLTAVYGSPGPGAAMRFDITIAYKVATAKYPAVANSNVSDPSYDWFVPTNGGSWPDAVVTWEKDGPKFFVPWLPVVTDC